MKVNRIISTSFSQILTLSLLFLIIGATQAPMKTSALKTIVIDAGHGGKDPGTIGRSSYEKNVALSISLELGRTIKQNMPNVKIVYTRLNDKFVELYRRAEIANEHKADLFISVHCNATPKRMANRHLVHGTEVYVMGLHKSEENLEVAKRENASIYKEANYQKNYGGFDPDSPQSYILLSLSQQTHLKNSLNLARKIDYRFKTHAKRKSRGVKQAGFVVLANTTMPSLLVECGFLSNPTEEIYLNSKAGQSKIAQSIYQAVRDYKKELDGN